MIYIKKFFIVFVCMILLSLTMVSSVFADFGYVFDGQYSKLTASSLVNMPFYTVRGEEPTNYMAYRVSLKSDTEYTFISTKGTRRFFFGDYVYGLGTHFYSSTNLLPLTPMFNSSFVNNNDGTYTLTKNSDEDRFSNFVTLDLPSSTYTFTINILSGDAVLNAQIYTSDGIFYPAFTSSGSFTFTGSPESLRIYIDSSCPNGSSFVVFNLSLTESSSSLPYEPFWNEPIYIDNFTTVYNFKTPTYGATYLPNSNLYDFIIGINDVTSGDPDKLFSKYQSEENIFYLVEGSYSVEDISLILDGNRYQNGYNDGYDVGFSQGETSGLESSGMLRNLIFTIFSVPFVFIRNALDFEILGINFKNIVLVLLSASLVAWVIRTFKKGE